MTKTVSRLAELIHETSSSLPEDAERALRAALRREAKGSSARLVLETILKNVALARAAGTPVCQDTGTLTFFVSENLRRTVTPERIAAAVAAATEKGWLRHNTNDAVTGKSIDSNVCPGAPVIHYTLDSDSKVRLIMKGGGSENMSMQFSLPDASLGAGRDLEGVRRAVLRGRAARRARGRPARAGLRLRARHPRRVHRRRPCGRF